MGFCLRSRLSVPTAILLLSLLVVGCSNRGPGISGHTSGTQTIGSREVKYDLDGPGGFVAGEEPNIGSVVFDGGTVMVDKNRLLLGDKEIAKLPATAKTISIDVHAGQLTVSVDGSTIFPAAHGK